MKLFYIFIIFFIIKLLKAEINYLESAENYRNENDKNVCENIITSLYNKIRDYQKTLNISMIPINNTIYIELLNNFVYILNDEFLNIKDNPHFIDYNNKIKKKDNEIKDYLVLFSNALREIHHDTILKFKYNRKKLGELINIYVIITDYIIKNLKIVLQRPNKNLKNKILESNFQHSYYSTNLELLNDYYKYIQLYINYYFKTNIPNLNFEKVNLFIIFFLI